jgi:hypothetical protein
MYPRRQIIGAIESAIHQRRVKKHDLARAIALHPDSPNKTTINRILDGRSPHTSITTYIKILQRMGMTIVVLDFDDTKHTVRRVIHAYTDHRLDEARAKAQEQDRQEELALMTAELARAGKQFADILKDYNALLTELTGRQPEILI